MKYSIIVPIYNGERYLNNCVESVLEQTYQEYELILVNDGSTDGSALICGQYARNNDRICVINKPNGGQASARNTGLSYSRGEYIIFLDCDDSFCNKDFLLLLNDCIGASNVDIVAYKYRDYFEDSEEIRTAGYSFASLPLESYERTLLEMIRMDAFFCSAWSKCVRRNVLIDNAILFDETSKCEDMDWYFQVVAKAQSIHVIDYEIVQYRRHSGSVTTTIGMKNLKDYLRFINDWEHIIEQSDTAIAKAVLIQALAKLYVNLILAYIQCKDAKKHELKKEILDHKDLLKYDENPVVHKINLASQLVGVQGVMLLLKFMISLR